MGFRVAIAHAVRRGEKSGVFDRKDGIKLILDHGPIWVFPKIVVPQNGWFIMEVPIKMDDLGVTLFSETPILIYIYIHLGVLKV